MIYRTMYNLWSCPLCYGLFFTKPIHKIKKNIILAIQHAAGRHSAETVKHVVKLRTYTGASPT
jgi:uncharacterized protein (DUF2225 family)